MSFGYPEIKPEFQYWVRPKTLVFNDGIDFGWLNFDYIFPDAEFEMNTSPNPAAAHENGACTVFYTVLTSNVVRLLAYLGLCAIFLQGGFSKLLNFSGAIGEMTHFGLWPAPLFAVLVIALELAAPVLILIGWLRWQAALALAAFTLMTIFLAMRFWELPPGQIRSMVTNTFYEHFGLIGGFLLVAWVDLREKRDR